MRDGWELLGILGTWGSNWTLVRSKLNWLGMSKIMQRNRGNRLRK
jgi:hypothetical protein